MKSKVGNIIGCSRKFIDRREMYYMNKKNILFFVAKNLVIQLYWQLSIFVVFMSQYSS